MSDGANGQGPTPADDFDRALRELTEGRAGGAKFHEPSAAERTREAAVRARQARKEALRNAKLAVKRARKHLREGGGHRGLLTGTLVVLVVVVLAGGLTWMRLGRTAGGAGDLQTAGTRHSDTITVTGPAAGPVPALSPQDLFNQPFGGPFYGVPAQAWADGAAGIVAPKARPAGPFTVAQVAFAYQNTRRLLVAAALDLPTLFGGRPTAFANLLTAGQRAQFLRDLNASGIGKDGTTLSSRALVASFAPGSTALIGGVIKVRGTMRAVVIYSQGPPVLSVSVDYRFVYPVQPPGLRPDWRRVIAEFSGTVKFGAWAGAKTRLAPWVAWSQGDFGARCDVADGYIHPAYSSDPPDTIRPAGTSIDPYLANTGPVHHSGCQAASRT